VLERHIEEQALDGVQARICAQAYPLLAELACAPVARECAGRPPKDVAGKLIAQQDESESAARGLTPFAESARDGELDFAAEPPVDLTIHGRALALAEPELTASCERLGTGDPVCEPEPEDVFTRGGIGFFSHGSATLCSVDKVFTPKDADFSARVRASFNRQQVMATLGVTLVQVDPGRVELELAFDPRLTQQHGFMHAGIIATALDSACGYAAFSLMPAEAGVLSVEYKINFIAPAAAERFLLIGTVVKAGRTLSVCQGEAIGVRGAERPLIATMTCTVMTVLGRSDIQQ
jgi:uncharacterized protein (TIGR00369 family)